MDSNRANLRDAATSAQTERPSSATAARVSVVIPTRDRGETVRAAVDSILAGSHRDVALYVVDQSDDRRTAEALGSVRDERLHYMRTRSRGVSAARNCGIQAATTPIVCLTDDDCVASDDWLECFLAAFAANGKIAVVHGNVVPALHDASEGYIPGYVRTQPFMARSAAEKLEVEGLSACMGIRREAWEALHGFDEMLGVGAPLGSGAETDFTWNALRRGYLVCETPEVHVTHYGFRRWIEVQDLVRRYWYGTGAVYAKQVRTHPGGTLPILAKLTLRWATRRSRIASGLGHKAYHAARLYAFWQGFLRGCILPLDPATEHFRPPRSTEPAPKPTGA